MMKNKNFMKTSMLVVMIGLKSSMQTLSLRICSLMLMLTTLLGKSWENLSSNSGISSKEINWNIFFRSSCFGHFLDLPIDPLPRFQMTIMYELLKRRFIFENPNKKDDIANNYCGMQVFFGIREFVIVTRLKGHPPVELIPEYIVITKTTKKA